MKTSIGHFSDTHNYHGTVVAPKTDILIFSGDFTGYGKESEVESFLRWFGNLPNKHKILIAGNHDRSFDKQYMREYKMSQINGYLQNFKMANGCYYLNHGSLSVEGINIFGSPYTPWFYGERWAFNLHRGQDIRDYWDMIPGNTDILVTHGPPEGIFDKTIHGDVTGCADLKQAIKDRPSIKAHLFGHIHEGYGMESIEGVVYSNASICDHRYMPINKPNIVEI